MVDETDVPKTLTKWHVKMEGYHPKIFEKVEALLISNACAPLNYGNVLHDNQ